MFLYILLVHEQIFLRHCFAMIDQGYALMHHPMPYKYKCKASLCKEICKKICSVIDHPLPKGHRVMHHGIAMIDHPMPLPLHTNRRFVRRFVR